MIQSLIGRLFSLQHNYTNPIQRQRARALLTMTWAGALIWLVLYLTVVLPLVNSGEIPGTGFIFIAMTLIPVLLVAIFVTLQRGQLVLASSLFVGGLLVLTVPLGLVSYVDLLQLMPLLALVAAGVLLERRGLLVVALICGASMVATASYQSQFNEAVRFIPADSVVSEMVTMLGIVLLATAFLYAFNGTPERVAREANVTVDQWRAVGALSERNFVDEGSAVESILRLARKDLNYSVAQVFLLSERLGGARRFRLAEGSVITALDVAPDVVVTTVLRDFDPLIIRMRDTRAPEHLVNPAQISVTVPILFEGISLGVLDVQSNTAAPPDAARIAVLKGLAAQLGRALAQNRRVTALEFDVRDQEAAAQRLRSQLAELQRRAEGATTAGWERYLRGLGVTGYGYDVEGEARTLTPASDLPPTVRAALERGDVHIERENGKQRISAPIAYRNQMLGAMTFIVPQERILGDSDMEMLRTVANRLGIALENNRLFEQSQAQALRERKASEVGGVLLTATDIEQLLALAAETFNEALGATHTRVSLQPGTLAQIDVEGG